MDGLFLCLILYIAIYLRNTYCWADLGNFVPVFKNSYFQFFHFFHVIFQILRVYKFEKKKLNLAQQVLKIIRYFHTLWTLDGGNRSVNTSEIVLWMWLGVKKMNWEKNTPKRGVEDQKIGWCPIYFFYRLMMKPQASERFSISFRKICR